MTPNNPIGGTRAALLSANAALTGGSIQCWTDVVAAQIVVAAQTVAVALCVGLAAAAAVLGRHKEAG